MHLRWLDKNGKQESLSYLRTRLTLLEVEMDGINFYLVHGFPGGNIHDEVWGSPNVDAQLIIGHTPVLYLIQDEIKRINYAYESGKQARRYSYYAFTGIYRYRLWFMDMIFQS